MTTPMSTIAPLEELAALMEAHGDSLSGYLERTLPTPVFSALSGSHLYGFASADSDFDLRGMHIAPAEQVIGIQPWKETITREDYQGLDLQSHDIGKFASLLAKGNVNAFEQLTSIHVVSLLPAVHAQLIRIASRLTSKQMIKHYQGFARSEFGEFQAHPTTKKFLYTARMLLGGMYFWATGVPLANLEGLHAVWSASPDSLHDWGVAPLDHELEIVRLAIVAKREGLEIAELPEGAFQTHEDALAVLFKAFADLMDGSAGQLRSVPEGGALVELGEFVIRARLAAWGVDDWERIERHPG